MRTAVVKAMFRVLVQSTSKNYIQLSLDQECNGIKDAHNENHRPFGGGFE